MALALLAAVRPQLLQMDVVALTNFFRRWRDRADEAAWQAVPQEGEGGGAVAGGAGGGGGAAADGPERSVALAPLSEAFRSRSSSDAVAGWEVAADIAYAIVSDPGRLLSSAASFKVTRSQLAVLEERFAVGVLSARVSPTAATRAAFRHRPLLPPSRAHASPWKKAVKDEDTNGAGGGEPGESQRPTVDVSEPNAAEAARSTDTASASPRAKRPAPEAHGGSPQPARRPPARAARPSHVRRLPGRAVRVSPRPPVPVSPAQSPPLPLSAPVEPVHTSPTAATGRAGSTRSLASRASTAGSDGGERVGFAPEPQSGAAGARGHDFDEQLERLKRDVNRLGMGPTAADAHELMKRLLRVVAQMPAARAQFDASARKVRAASVELEELLERKHDLKAQLHVLVYGSPTPPGRDGPAAAGGAKAAEAGAGAAVQRTIVPRVDGELMKAFSAKLGATDERLRPALARWRAALWKHTLARTALEELDLAKQRFSEQIVALTAAVEREKERRMLEVWRSMGDGAAAGGS